MNYINPSPIKAAITAVGAYVPEDKLTNADLEKMVDTNDEWIVARTGIKERRILKDPSKGTSFMAIKAAEKAAAAHGFSLAQLTGGETAAPKKRGRKPGPKAAKPKKAGAPRYKNPADASQTWTGKGRQPVWFKDAVAAGADPESMAI